MKPIYFFLLILMLFCSCKQQEEMTTKMYIHSTDTMYKIDSVLIDRYHYLYKTDTFFVKQDSVVVNKIVYRESIKVDTLIKTDTVSIIKYVKVPKENGIKIYIIIGFCIVIFCVILKIIIK